MSNTKISSEQIIDGVALAGNPTTTTQSAGNNTTRVATTAFVTTAVANIVDSAPAALNTLNEIAAAINDDANINTTLTNSIAAKLPLAGGTMTGTLNVTGDGEDVIINSADYELVLIGNRGSSGANLDKAYIRMKSEGTNVICLDADGFTYLSGGNVGIGQAFGGTVDELLHVEKSSGTTIVKTEVAANSVVGFEIKKTGATTSNWRLVDGQTVNGNLEIYDVTDSRSVMIFDGDGDIGMGVTPLSNVKLTLGGTSTSYSSVLGFDNNTTGGATFFMLASDDTWSAGGNKFLMGHGAPSSSAVDVAIDADGRVGIGSKSTSPQYALDVSGTSDITMRIHRPSSGLAATDTCGIGFSQRGDDTTSSSDTRAGIFSTYNGNIFLATESGGNLNSNPYDHAALEVTGGGAVNIKDRGQQYALAIEGNARGLRFTTGSNQRIYWNTHRALEGAADGSNLQVGEGFTKINIQGRPVVTADSVNHFKLSKTISATGSSVTRHSLDINDLIGAGTGGTLRYEVSFVGYGSGGSNGANFKYSVGGYSGHNYAAQNYGSFGAGTIQNGYKSSNSTSYTAVGLGYHPAINMGAYINNGEIYVYVPSAQTYGVTISNNAATFGGILTVEGYYT